jgi:hypothetical protein
MISTIFGAKHLLFFDSYKHAAHEIEYFYGWREIMLVKNPTINLFPFAGHSVKVRREENFILVVSYTLQPIIVFFKTYLVI